MTTEEFNTCIYEAVKAAVLASESILSHYEQKQYQIYIKSDESEVTTADHDANAIILKQLSATNIPVISEEEQIVDFEQRKNWSQVWIIDPLDGTKGFIQETGEFAVNIALIENQKPRLGVIAVPTIRKVYFGGKGLGTFVYEFAKGRFKPKDAVELMVNAQELMPQPEHKPLKIITSKYSNQQAFKNYAKQNIGALPYETAYYGGARKFCLIAEGEFDRYTRFLNAHEWDIAAGHALVEGVGKQLLAFPDLKEVLYNKPNLINEWFVIE